MSSDFFNSFINCGTKPIVFSAHSISSNPQATPNKLYGVACGFEDTYWAEKTIGMVPLLVNELKKSDEITINNFLKYWEEKIKKK